MNHDKYLFVTIIHKIANLSFDIKISSEITVQKLTSEILKWTNLTNANQNIFRLRIINQKRVIFDNQTMLDAGVNNGDVLEIF
jgi:uncharacterized ubiquitin-like protein YukD